MTTAIPATRFTDDEPVIVKGSVRFYPNLTQGSDEWIAARCGLLTASEMKLIVTPTLKIASNDKERAHLYELLAQRITGYVEPHYISDDMLRGLDDEITAAELYAKHYSAVREIGFVTNDRFGFTLGYSPDRLVDEDCRGEGEGQIECKSRRQKYQVQTIVECVPGEECPADYLIQVQTGLLVTERAWCDLVSYSGGLPMAVMRVHPMAEVQEAILEAAAKFEARIASRLADYRAALAEHRMIPTERKVAQEMYV